MNRKELYDWTINGPWIMGDLKTQWAYAVIDGTLHIKFQGSVESEDWKDNFDFLVKPYRDMKDRWFAHRGFLKRWKAVQNDVIEVVKENGGLPIIVSGFSQGAAIAVLCYEDIKFQLPGREVRCKVFGCPRVAGWCMGQTVVNRFKDVERVEVDRDIVPKIPPFIFGFRHVGSRVKVEGKYCRLKFMKNHMSYEEVI